MLCVPHLGATENWNIEQLPYKDPTNASNAGSTPNAIRATNLSTSSLKEVLVGPAKSAAQILHTRSRFHQLLVSAVYAAFFLSPLFKCENAVQLRGFSVIAKL